VCSKQDTKSIRRRGHQLYGTVINFVGMAAHNYERKLPLCHLRLPVASCGAGFNVEAVYPQFVVDHCRRAAVLPAFFAAFPLRPKPFFFASADRTSA
jgi:hypothetical protein